MACRALRWLWHDSVMRLVRNLGLTVGLLATMMSCGGSGSGQETGETPADTQGTSCVDVPRVELGAPEGWFVCADSGMVASSDEFSFENWGGPVSTDAFTPQLLVSIFGQENVCMPDTTGCVLYPAAQQWMDQMNAAIEGGRCEGMATLSQRVLLGRDSADSLQSGAITTSDLSRDSADVGSSIALWWASQTFDEVRESTYPTRDLEPSQIVSEVIDALQSSAGPTIGIYGNGQAHALTPIAVSTDGSGSFIIHVYDNNYPGRILPLNVSAADEAWSYDMAAANAGESSEVWGGGVGTLDLTLMDSREAPTSAPWSDNSSTKGSTVISVSTKGQSSVGLRITTGSSVIDTRDPKTWIDGVRVFPMLGAVVGTGVSVVVPPSVGTATVVPIVGDLLTADPQVDLLLTADFPGSGSTQFEGEIDPNSDVDLPEFTFEGDEGDY